MLAAFKPSTNFEAIKNYEIGNSGIGTLGNLFCSNSSTELSVAEYFTADPTQVASMINFMNAIPDGYYVLAYNVRNHRLSDLSAFTPTQLDSINSFFTSIGAEELINLPSDSLFIAFGRKNVPTYETQILLGSNDPPFEGSGLPVSYFLSAEPVGHFDNGEMVSTLIGPAKSWQTLKWDGEVESGTVNENFLIEVHGVRADGQDSLLLTVNQLTDKDLSGINAAEFRYLKLHLLTTDTTQYTPFQLDHWRVLFQMAPELAISKKDHFVFLSDTLQAGDPMHLEFALMNASAAASDSVVVRYTLTDQNNVSRVVLKTYAPIGSNQTAIIRFDYDTELLSGLMQLSVEVNPNEVQVEKFHFNNYLILNFFVQNDHINPIVDVTFNGRHILDGDLISAKPTVQIRLKDENLFLALNDTSDFSIQVLLPNGTLQAISLGDDNLHFTPATSSAAANGDNEAMIEWQPTFMLDGVYTLIIQATDRSSNAFGAQPYRISFEVQTKPMISNVLNYPNPFTSSTQFVFTITGSTVPQFVKIQILTVTGRVVREITQSELGPLYVGKNLTQFRWDGTDEFGSPLANGLYLYRVSARLDGKSLDHYSNGAVDDLFKNGIGKMYLLR